MNILTAKETSIYSAITALLSGSIFGAGLAISGMTDTNKVLGFLDITGSWDPSLLFVMAAALMISIPGFYYVNKRQMPFFNKRFFLPDNHQIDIKLLSGATLFGSGWGLYGYCPGPALASITTMHGDTLIFIACMLLGMYLADKFVNQP